MYWQWESLVWNKRSHSQTTNKLIPRLWYWIISLWVYYVSIQEIIMGKMGRKQWRISVHKRQHQQPVKITQGQIQNHYNCLGPWTLQEWKKLCKYSKCHSKFTNIWRSLHRKRGNIAQTITTIIKLRLLHLSRERTVWINVPRCWLHKRIESYYEIFIRFNSWVLLGSQETKVLGCKDW